MMRQDPDVILVGEIRDQETAEMAFRAAMTGHQVYSTLHTNSAIGAFPRLLDIGIVPDIMAGNIIGIIAQRLVRKLCRTCRQSYDPDVQDAAPARALADRAGHALPRGGLRAVRVPGLSRPRRASSSCSRSTPSIDELIARRATAREILDRGARKGFRTLADDGVRLRARWARPRSRRSCAWST